MLPVRVGSAASLFLRPSPVMLLTILSVSSIPPLPFTNESQKSAVPAGTVTICLRLFEFASCVLSTAISGTSVPATVPRL